MRTDSYEMFLIDNDFAFDWSGLGFAVTNIALSGLLTFVTFSAAAWDIRFAIL